MRAQEQRPRQARNDSFGAGENIAACGEAAPHFCHSERSGRRFLIGELSAPAATESKNPSGILGMPELN